MTHKVKFTWLWFILGLGSETQVVASLSFSDAIVLMVAPFLFPKVVRGMRRDGVMFLWVLSVLLIVGCIVACIENHCDSYYVIRGLAVTCIMSSSIIFGYWIMSADPGGVKWMLLGVALSMIICTFIFQHSGEITIAGGAGGKAAVDSIVSGPLFWITRVGAFLTLPTRGWYLHTSIIYDVFAILFLVVFSMVTSSSGRSTALGAIGAVVLILIGGKTIRTMKRLGRHFFMFAAVAVVGIFVIHAAYRISALNGWLGENARVKYERQSNGSGSILRLIIGGRAESFVGLFACCDKPIVGWGPWARDVNDYCARFTYEYGTDDDIEAMKLNRAWLLSKGVSRGNFLIPCHSYITEFWLWYGIFGLIFWLYVVFVIIRYLKSDAWAIPQWYGWLAAGMPAYLWNVFFSPFGHRVVNILIIVACLMARAVKKGRSNLPQDMVVEIGRAERL